MVSHSSGLPPPRTVPRHVAVIMDGNGRWAGRRALPRSAGHQAGIRPVRMCVEECARQGVEVLTLFAFSSENWQRPAEEVGLLMRLFLEALDREVDELHGNGIRLRFIGDLESLAAPLRERIDAAAARNPERPRLELVVATAYGGQWDLTRAARRLAADCLRGGRTPDALTPQDVAAATALGELGLPDPDLFIRTGGEQRVSNFLLWNLAYTELYFTDVLWPAFDAAELQRAFEFYASRQRRFGRTAAQLEAG